MASFQEALQIEQLDANLDFKASLLCSIGDTYVKQDRLDNALDAYMKELNMLKRITPSGDTLDIALSLCRIADMHNRQGQKEQALNIYCEALEIRTRVLPEDHADTRDLNELIAGLVNSV